VGREVTLCPSRGAGSKGYSLCWRRDGTTYEINLSTSGNPDQTVVISYIPKQLQFQAERERQVPAPDLMRSMMRGLPVDGYEHLVPAIRIDLCGICRRWDIFVVHNSRSNLVANASLLGRPLPNSQRSYSVLASGVSPFLWRLASRSHKRGVFCETVAKPLAV
jgi:hypothetical protein